MCDAIDDLFPDNSEEWKKNIEGPFSPLAPNYFPEPPEDPEDPKKGSNDPKINNAQADKILKQNGYKQVKGLNSQGNKVYFNPKPPKGAPKYMVRSNTSHRGDAFKGFNSQRDVDLGRRAGSYNVRLQWVGK